MILEKYPMIRPHDFYYSLPDDRIAQVPASPRDSAKLMVVDELPILFLMKFFLTYHIACQKIQFSF